MAFSLSMIALCMVVLTLWVLFGGFPEDVRERLGDITKEATGLARDVDLIEQKLETHFFNKRADDGLLIEKQAADIKELNERLDERTQGFLRQAAREAPLGAPLNAKHCNPLLEALKEAEAGLSVALEELRRLGSVLTIANHSSPQLALTCVRETIAKEEGRAV